MRRTWTKKITNQFNKISFANKITFMYGGIFAIIFSITSVIIMINASNMMWSYSKKELEKTTHEVAAYIKSGQEITNEALKELAPSKQIQIRVVNFTTRQQNEAPAQMDTTTESMEPHMPAPPGDIVFNQNDMQVWAKKVRFNGEKGVRFIISDETIENNGMVYMINATRPDPRGAQFTSVFGIIFMLVNVVGVVGAFVIGRYISKKMLKPIVDIIKTAEQISINDLTQRIDVPEPDDEIRELAVTFNEMIGRLETSFEKQAQFVSDASHELRTPISVIQGYANLIDRWGKKDTNVLQESIDSIKSETEHMTMLIKKLLFLAKGEQKKIPIQENPLLLNYVAAEIIKEIDVIEISNKILLIEDSEETIYGDFDLIKQMLWIFLDNSIKYSGNDKDIVLKVFGDKEKSHISIKDSGVGISEDDITKVFERFYRVDKSRSKEIPGTGLGLSIANVIIKQHKAKVVVNSELGAGTEIIISFPKYKIEKSDPK